MNRRQYLAAVGALATVGCLNADEPEPDTPDSNGATPPRVSTDASTEQPARSSTCTVENGTDRVAAKPITFRDFAPDDAAVVLEATVNGRVQATVDEDPDDASVAVPNESDQVFMVFRIRLHNPADHPVPLNRFWLMKSHETAGSTGNWYAPTSHDLPEAGRIEGGDTVGYWEERLIPESATKGLVTVNSAAYDDTLVGATFTCDESLDIGVVESSD